MKKFVITTKCLSVALTLAAVAAAGTAPAFAVARHSATRSSKPYRRAPNGLGQSELPASQTEVARDAAIQLCSTKASKYSFNTWQTTQFAVYGTCMKDHHQPL